MVSARMSLSAFWMIFDRQMAPADWTTLFVLLISSCWGTFIIWLNSSSWFSNPSPFYTMWNVIWPRVSEITTCRSEFPAYAFLSSKLRILPRYGMSDSSNTCAALPYILMYSFFCGSFMWEFSYDNLLKNMIICSCSRISCIMKRLISSLPMAIVWISPNFERIWRRERSYSRRGSAKAAFPPWL